MTDETFEERAEKRRQTWTQFPNLAVLALTDEDRKKNLENLELLRTMVFPELKNARLDKTKEIIKRNITRKS